MKQPLANVTLRIPFDLHQFLAEEAEKNMRTLNNQMLVWIKQQKEAKELKEKAA